MLKVFGGVLAEQYGSGAPDILALHGWGRDRSDFAGVLAGRNALAVDLPGFGSAAAPPDVWGAAEYSGAISPMLDDMADSVVLVGHSFGGRVALHLALADPDRVTGVVFAAVPLLKRAGPAPTVRPAFRFARSLHERGLLGDDMMERLRRRYGSEDYRAAAGVMRSILVKAVNEEYADELGRLACPVELVWGSGDTAVPVDVALRAEELMGAANVTLTVLEGVGHHVPLEAPGAIVEAVDRLLS